MTVSRGHSPTTPQPREHTPALVAIAQDLDRVLPHQGIRTSQVAVGDAWVVRAQLPDLGPHGAIDLSLDGPALTIDVARHPKRTVAPSGHHQLHQIVSVPVGTRLEDIDATFADGVLVLTMPVVSRHAGRRAGSSSRARIPLTEVAAPAPPSTGDRVVVGVDGSAGGAAALRWALPLVRQEHGVLEIVAAWTNPTEGAVRQLPGHVNEQRELAARVAGAAAGLARRELPDDVPVTTVVVMGDPAEVLIERARGARFLVLGSPRTLGRGVPADCQAQVHCPIFVVLPPAEPARGSGDDDDRNR
jgi:HSP20 family molecular chaperone IbpA